MTWIIPWSNEDSARACAEGWDVFDLDGKGPEIEFLQDTQLDGLPPSPFNDDDEAIAHCIERARAGSDLHIRALRLEQSWDHLLTRNPYPNGDELWPAGAPA